MLKEYLPSSWIVLAWMELWLNKIYKIYIHMKILQLIKIYRTFSILYDEMLNAKYGELLKKF